MDSSQQHPVSDEEARRAAKSLVHYFRAPLKVFGNRGLEEPPLTIADTILMSGTFLAAINVATGRDWLKEQNREFLAKIAELIYLPEAMEEFLYTRIRDKAENPDDIAKAISQIEEQLAGPGAVRKFIKRVITEVLPKARQGRPTAFNPDSDPDRFLALSAQLSGVCGKFLTLREEYPRKSNEKIIAFIQSEDPQSADILRKRESCITLTIHDSDFSALKTHETKTRRLADAVSGKELFGWSFSYAVQRAGEFRRSKGIALEE